MTNKRALILATACFFLFALIVVCDAFRFHGGFNSRRRGAHPGFGRFSG